MPGSSQRALRFTGSLTSYDLHYVLVTGRHWPGGRYQDGLRGMLGDSVLMR